MKKLIILILAICFSCQKKQIANPCIEIEKKYDSLLNLKKANDKMSFNKFYNILSKENGEPNDSILIDTKI